MKLGYEIYIRTEKDKEPEPIENISLEERKQLGEKMNDTFLKAAGYTPIKSTCSEKTFEN